MLGIAFSSKKVQLLFTDIVDTFLQNGSSKEFLVKI